jgi:hypothetical protein
MVQIEQRYYERRGGDCFQACLASLLECPLEDVPLRRWNKNGDAWHFYKDRLTHQFLRQRGLQVVGVMRWDNTWLPLGNVITTVSFGLGMTPHSLITRGKHVVWDPNPRRDRYEVIPPHLSADIDYQSDHTVAKWVCHEFLIPNGDGEHPVFGVQPDGMVYPVVFKVRSYRDMRPNGKHYPIREVSMVGYAPIDPASVLRELRIE